jgi:small subunit ribosomal protein S3Ae
MAIGKNKRLTKSKKGQKGKKIIDPFKNKHKYEIRAPSYFPVRNVGNTIVTKTIGNKIASDSLKNRVVPVCLADLKADEEEAHRIVKLRVEDVQDRRVLTNFYGIQLTTDKLRSLVRKWQTLIEIDIDVKTTDGYALRVFVIAFTAKRPNAAKKTYYAQAAQIRQIRKKGRAIIRKTISATDLKGAVDIILNNKIEKQVEAAARSVYPLKDVYVRKVKMLKSPKFELRRLMEIQGDTKEVKRLEDRGIKADEPKKPAEPVVGEEKPAPAK